MVGRPATLRKGVEVPFASRFDFAQEVIHLLVDEVRYLMLSDQSASDLIISALSAATFRSAMTRQSWNMKGVLNAGIRASLCEYELVALQQCICIRDIFEGTDAQVLWTKVVWKKRRKLFRRAGARRIDHEASLGMSATSRS